MSNSSSSGHVVLTVEAEESSESRVLVSTRSAKEDESFDEDMLHKAIGAAGRWAYGTVIVEIWVLKDDQTALYRPNGGWWIDPVWHHCVAPEECKLCRATDPSTPGYVPPPPVAPGVGLAGLLWSESTSLGRRRADGRQGVVWWDLHALQEDPDQPPDSRVRRIGECGLGYAGGVYFQNNGHRGIVIFVARSGVDLNKLRSETNEAYLWSAADLIGSAWAIREPRRAAQLERKRELDAALRRARIKLQAMVRLGIRFSSLEDKSLPPEQTQVHPASMHDQFQDKVYVPTKTGLSKLKRRLLTTARKCKGGGVSPSPPFSIEASVFTFFGVFCTLLLLTKMNSFIEDDAYDMELGPFGALMTLQYSLTAAPASQPPNAILGQAISLTIAIGIASIDGLDLWLRQSLATALAITVMAKLGITHPPAGAAALIFAGGNNSWGNLVMMLVGNCIAVITSTLINNFNLKRQYPTLWGIGLAYNELKRLLGLCIGTKRE